jgi:hypothetical protein
MGPVALKLYDKQALVLRIETTVNDVSFFQHHRTVEHRDGTTERKLAPMQKTIYSLVPLRGLLRAANHRYLAFLCDLTDPTAGVQQIAQVAEPIRQDDRSYRGFNLFSAGDLALFIVYRPGARRMADQWLPQRQPAAGLAALFRSAALARAQTLARAWPDQEGRAHLQVLSDTSWPTGRLDRLEAAGARRDSLPGWAAPSRRLTFCASCDPLYS